MIERSLIDVVALGIDAHVRSVSYRAWLVNSDNVDGEALRVCEGYKVTCAVKTVSLFAVAGSMT